MFSSRSFRVSGLTFKSLIHFELIFVSGIRWGPVFSFLSFLFACDYPVFPALLRRLFLPIEYSWLPFQILVNHIAQVYFCTLDSVLLFSGFVPYCCNYCNFVIQFKIEMCNVSNFVLFQDCFGYSQSLVVLFFYKEYHWNLDSIALNIQMAVNKMDILVMLILPTHEHRIFFHLFVFFVVFFINQFSSSMTKNDQCPDLLLLRTCV